MTWDSGGPPSRVHIIGIAGSGKTTLAHWFSEHFALQAYDLDWIAYSEHGETPLPEIERRIAAIIREGGWVTEGAYGDAWVIPLVKDADLIVWLDAGLATCLARMVKRHVRAELSRTNQHPGWLRLIRFMNYTRGSANDQRRRTVRLLAPYQHKVHRCRISRDVSRLKSVLRSSLGEPYGGTTTKSSPS